MLFWMPSPTEEQGPPTVAMEPVTRGGKHQVRKEIASFFYRNRTFHRCHAKNYSSIYRMSFERRNITFSYLLCFVDRASVYDLVNKANLVQSVFLVYLSIYMFRATVCPSSGETTVLYAGCIPDSHPHNNNYQVSHKHSCYSWWWAHSRLKHVEIGKFTKNKMCIKLDLFIRLQLSCCFTGHFNSLCVMV
jgi:hypothetical protein